MRKLIIIAASLAALAIPTAAIASVAVATTASAPSARATFSPRSAGTTPTFDKGAGSLKFTASAEKVIADYTMSCFNVQRRHRR